MKDIFDEAADLVILEHSRTSEMTRVRMADIYRRVINGQLETAAHDIDVQTERLNAAIRSGEAQTVKYVITSLIDLSAQIKSIQAKLTPASAESTV